MSKFIHRLSTGSIAVTGNCNVKKRNCYQGQKQRFPVTFGNPHL
jgi:hypothetical protein